MTYGDLVTLLMVFFVVLYTMTPGVDPTKFQQFLIPFQGNRMVMQNESVMNPQEIITSMNQQAQQMQNLQDFIEDNELRDQVDIELTPEGIRISLSEGITFPSGSARLLPGAMGILAEIATILEKDIHEIEVQGHTDNVPVSAGSRFGSNWDLGAARSVSVVQVLIDNSSVESRRFRATSFGEYRPIRENDSAENRQRNRRVEIYVRYTELMQGGAGVPFVLEEEIPSR